MLNKLKKYIINNKLPLIIFLFIIFDTSAFINYLSKDHPQAKLKEIKPIFVTQSLSKPTLQKLAIENINPSVISDKTIYLTFDDGPSYLTENILNILKEESVPATFFVTSRQIDKYQNIIQREYRENHTVALHTSTHEYSYIYSSDENYFNDLLTIKKQVFHLTGNRPRIVRLPGGSSNTISKKYNPGIINRITHKLTDDNYYYYDWNIDSLDASGTNIPSETIYNSVTSKIKNGTNIVLMHDSSTKQTTVNALKSIIEYGKNNGYTFAKITPKTPPIHHHINN